MSRGLGYGWAATDRQKNYKINISGNIIIKEDNNKDMRQMIGIGEEGDINEVIVDFDGPKYISR